MSSARDRTQHFEPSIGALSRVTVSPHAATTTTNVIHLRPAVPSDEQGQSLGAELVSSVILLLTILVPILLVALAAH